MIAKIHLYHSEEYPHGYTTERTRVIALQAENDRLRALLAEILPMQGCITCQEEYSPCNLHGDITKTTKAIEAELEQK